MNAKPFVKWAGGKTQLLASIQKNYPSELGKSITRYCEPFVGGGAVFFDVISKYKLKKVLINDINQDLINTYSQIKYDVNALIHELENLQSAFWPLTTEKRKEFFYDKRDRFNHIKANRKKAAKLEKATLFIFLNKTCFNGLFRVNRQGFFNVPMGAYKKPTICDKQNLLSISSLLQNVTIQCADYQNCLSFIDKNTFVYVDPPYRPLTATASFTAYTENPFDDNEQLALGKFVDKLHHIGAKIVISNSDPQNSDKRDTFFDDLYSAYQISRVSAKRMINCSAENRGSINELLISNY